MNNKLQTTSQNGSSAPARIMRNTSLNLTSSASSGQTSSKRLVIKNLKGKNRFY